MVAMALAGSTAFTARHRVVAVLTAGSPVATRAGPAGTAVLHLEHRQDLVPALDGRRNPDRPERTTAVRDLAVSPDPADRLAARSPGAAHGLDAYARTARAVSARGGPSVRAWERAAATVFGGPGVVVVHREFTGEREPVRARVRVLAPGPGPSVVSARGPGSPR
jgi:antitoxin (DNA-binding transcriptional repressor) of toxin-antitoxin stability system